MDYPLQRFQKPFLVLGLAIGLPAVPAQAGFVDLPGGWTATWDASLDGLVDVTGALDLDGNLIIEKTAEFTQGSVNGVFPAINIVFTQNEVNAAEYIVIDDEIITNSTGEDWLDFHIELLNDGDAVFDPALTLASGGSGPIGWTIDPFTVAAFSADLTALDISGGVVANGTQWFPGDGATNGQLWIDVTLGDGDVEPFTTFILKEFPTIPTPSALAALALGGLALRRRRRG